MKMLTFKRQIIFGILLIIIGNTLAFALHNGIFSNIAWILYGLLFLFNPVYPEHFDCKKGKLGARIAGILCIVIGLITRFIV